MLDFLHWACICIIFELNNNFLTTVYNGLLRMLCAQRQLWHEPFFFLSRPKEQRRNQTHCYRSQNLSISIFAPHFEGHKQQTITWCAESLFVVAALRGFWVICAIRSAAWGYFSRCYWWSTCIMVRLKGHNTGWFVILITHHYKEIQSLYWLDTLCHKVVWSVCMWAVVTVVETQGHKKNLHFWDVWAWMCLYLFSPIN